MGPPTSPASQGSFKRERLKIYPQDRSVEHPVPGGSGSGYCTHLFPYRVPASETNSLNRDCKITVGKHKLVARQNSYGTAQLQEMDKTTFPDVHKAGRIQSKRILNLAAFQCSLNERTCLTVELAEGSLLEMVSGTLPTPAIYRNSRHTPKDPGFLP